MTNKDKTFKQCSSCELSTADDEYLELQTYEQHTLKNSNGEKLGLLCEECMYIYDRREDDRDETPEHEYTKDVSDNSGYDEHLSESTEFLPNYDEHILEAKLEEADRQMLIDDVMVVINAHKGNVYCTREELARKIMAICQFHGNFDGVQISHRMFYTDTD
jgi:hypothetical protein